LFLEEVAAIMTMARPHCEPKAELEPLLYRIHASTDANADWSAVLEQLRDRLAGRLAILSRHHFASGQGAIICEFPESPRFRSEYPQYASRNPWFLSSEAFTPGRVMTGNELLSNRDLVKTDFYRDLLEPHGLFHCLSGVATRRGSLIYLVSVHRAQEEAAYGEREKAGLRAILAHLSLALENRWRLRQSADLTKVMMGVVDRHPHPSLLVDGDGRIVHCNRSARALSAPRTGLCIEGGRLAATKSVDRAALAEAIREVAKATTSDTCDATRAVTLSVPGARHPAVVSVHAAGRVFRVETGEIDELVLVTARNPDCEHDLNTCAFVKQFGLSPAQARVGAMIVSGHSLADTARTLHVSDNTARSHLKQIFQKTNTHGQMELVHLHSRICGNGG
jgi:DNA-binding CsgD family transcriptional regulator/PAS domain-containing protein